MFAAVSLAIAMNTGQTVQDLGLIPKPEHLESTGKSFTFDASTVVVAAGAARAIGSYTCERIEKATGLKLPVANRGKRSTISFQLAHKLKRDLGTEGYSLTCSQGKIQVRAAEPDGLFYGAQTLMQLLDSQARTRSQQFQIPEISILDRPRFSWRGAHMDVARHFQPKEFILKFLDLMAMHKLNTFHWHLTEDQGWRIEIKKYPKLTQIGSKRTDTMLVYNPPKYTGQPHEGFYTQEEIKEVVAYAKQRFITVVPEIEMPGHAQAAIAAYPELGNGQQVDVLAKWGVSENVFNVKDSTLAFLQDVLEEAMALFPGQFIHIGGDECPKTQWKASAFAQAKMQKLELKDEHELQSWFIRQMDQFMASRQRRLIGWSEILEGGLAPGAALMVWLGDEGAMQAVSSGHDVVMAQTTHTYFDYYQSKDRKNEPHAIGGFLPLEKVYQYNPILPAMSAEQAKHVLGCQFQLWSEYIPNPKQMEYMAFPRACALAEVAWTPQEQRSFADFMSRLPTHLKRLEAMGVNYRKLE